MRFAVFALVAVLASASALLTAPQSVLSQSAGVPITGYAWSDTIGWIDLNCANSEVCNTNPFGFSIDASGNLSGYAWSGNIGWVSANSSDLTGCPSAPCSAQISGGALTGWLKAIAADGNGWDGFISLNGSNYGVTETGGVFSGYAWGSTNVGWLDFRYASTTYGTCTPAYSCSGNTIIYTAASCAQSAYATCTTPSFCSAGSNICLYPQPTPVQSAGLTGNLQAIPKLLAKGETTQLYWDMSNVAACSVTSINGDSWTGLASPSSGETSKPIYQQTLFTLSCTELDSSTSSQSITVDTLPVFHEK